MQLDLAGYVSFTYLAPSLSPPSRPLFPPGFFTLNLCGRDIGIKNNLYYFSLSSYTLGQLCRKSTHPKSVLGVLATIPYFLHRHLHLPVAPARLSHLSLTAPSLNTGPKRLSLPLPPLSNLTDLRTNVASSLEGKHLPLFIYLMYYSTLPQPSVQY